MHQRLSERSLAKIGPWRKANEGGSRTEYHIECWTHVPPLRTAYLVCGPPVIV